MTCMLGFSSTLSTTAFTGGFRYNPHRFGSLGSKLFVRTHTPTASPLQIDSLATQNAPDGVHAGVETLCRRRPVPMDMPGGGGSSSRASTWLRNGVPYRIGLPAAPGPADLAAPTGRNAGAIWKRWRPTRSVPATPAESPYPPGRPERSGRAPRRGPTPSGSS
jgi:hypothetical protein